MKVLHIAIYAIGLASVVIGLLKLGELVAIKYGHPYASGCITGPILLAIFFLGAMAGEKK